MITIETPNDLPHGVDLRMYSVANEAEALRIADNGKAYLFQSHTIKALYLFVPVKGIVPIAAAPAGTRGSELR